MEINFDIDTDQLADDMEVAIQHIVSSYLSNELPGEIEDYFCNSNTVENIVEREVRDLVSGESEIENLLSSYNPGNGCTLGNEFTDAVSRAIKHIFGGLYISEISKSIDIKECVNTAVAEYIQVSLSNALSTEVRKAIIDGVANSLRNDILLEVKKAFTNINFLHNI